MTRSRLQRGGDTPAILKRQDDDFPGLLNKDGYPKTRIDSDGALAPLNPESDTTLLQHIMANRNPKAKANSPFSSFSSLEGNGKVYGSPEIWVDSTKLQLAIDAGEHPGLEIVPPQVIQDTIQAEINRIAGKHVEIDLSYDIGRDDLREYNRTLGISNSKANDLAPRIRALLNTRVTMNG
ncbi:hypothetical protein ACW2Q0_29240 [Nocardia sp. R16R-3T]